MWRSSLFVVVICCLLLVSCKSTKSVRIGEVSNMTDAQLRKQLLQNELSYDKLYLKKVQFSYTDGDIKKSFKGSFVIKKDSMIIASIYALMGIELVRAKLTKNEVVILDKHNKKVITTNYSFFLDRYGIDLNFESLQAILSNSLFIYPNEEDYYDGLKKYKHHIDNSYYSFKSFKDKRIGRLNKREKNNLIVHEIDIYPDIFKIFNVYIKDFSSNQSLNIKYSNFKNFEETMFPELINMSAEKGIKKYQIDLKINYFELNDGGSLHFKIPSSYKIADL